MLHTFKFVSCTHRARHLIRSKLYFTQYITTYYDYIINILHSARRLFFALPFWYECYTFILSNILLHTTFILSYTKYTLSTDYSSYYTCNAEPRITTHLILITHHLALHAQRHAALHFHCRLFLALHTCNAEPRITTLSYSDYSPYITCTQQTIFHCIVYYHLTQCHAALLFHHADFLALHVQRKATQRYTSSQTTLLPRSDTQHHTFTTHALSLRHAMPQRCSFTHAARKPFSHYNHTHHFSFTIQ